ncbi:heterokaryon incompatibility protein-domain-containing protein [Xylariales sp. PMI_506]|nr:heterokaryon incompatibility protein-domain-containing protein [Xylariales sp. PMI_506]
MIHVRPHRPLSRDEIRLVSIDPRGQDTEISLKLEHVSLGDKPRFVAVSYVWGAPDDNVTVSLDSVPFQVTRNLYDALWQVKELLRIGELGAKLRTKKNLPQRFWIDALCINQEDNQEKAAQIPRMRDVYTSAVRVLGWLGKPDQDQFKYVPHLADIANYLGSDPRRYESNYLEDYPLETMIQCPTEIFISTLLRILWLPWFFRLWIRQEATLARRPVILLMGQLDVNLEELYILKRALWVSPLVRANDRWKELSFASGLSNIMVTRRVYRDMVPEQEATGGSELVQFGKRLRMMLGHNHLGTQATILHDRIYGLLGVAGAPQLPEDLVPDYDKPFEEVCWQYTRFLLVSTRDVSMLPRRRTKFDRGALDVPSWVINFKNAWGHKSPPEDDELIGHLSVSQDGKVLSVEGVELGEVNTARATPGKHAK